MTALFERALSSMFNRLGITSLYQPQHGSPIPLKVIIRQPDDVIGIGQSSWQTSTVLMDIRILDVTLPKAGDRVIVNTISYQLQGEPRRDQHHLLWTVEAFVL